MSAQHNQKIDHLLRERLYDAQVTPPPFVWTAVERELRRQRRRALWWWFSGASVAGALVVASALWWTNARTGEDTPALSTNTPNNPTTASTDASGATTAGLPRAATSAAPTASLNPTTSEGQDARFSPPPHPTSGNIAPKHFTAKSPISIPPTTSTLPTNSTTPTRPAGVAPLTYAAVSSPVLAEKALQTPIVALVEGENAASPAVAEPAIQQPIVTPSASAERASESLASQLSLLATARFSAPIVSLYPTPGPGKLPRQPIRPYTKRKKDTPKGCYDFDSHRNAWLLDAYAGPLLARQHLEYHGSIEQASYLGQRQQTESGGWGFQGGLRGTYVFNRHWMLRTGVHYEQFTEVFEYVDPTSIEVLIKQVYDVNTGQIRIDTVDVNFGAARTRTYNRFGMASVPLELGYELRSGHKGLSVHGGTSLNVLFWKRGALLDPNTGQPAYFTPGKTDATEVFVARAGLSASLSAQAFWYLRPRVRVFAEPSVRHTLRSVTTTQHPIEQRWSTWGVRFGVTRIF